MGQQFVLQINSKYNPTPSAKVALEFDVELCGHT